MAEKTMNEKEKYLDEIEDKIRTIGVLTSGGDAPGMNAAIRAVVRRALAKGLKVRGIRRGYHGLLKEEIIDLTARDVSDIVQRGGTILQTARCKTMRTEEGQQKAAAICKKYGIDGLVVIHDASPFIFVSFLCLSVFDRNRPAVPAEVGFRPQQPHSFSQQHISRPGRQGKSGDLLRPEHRAFAGKVSLFHGLTAYRTLHRQSSFTQNKKRFASELRDKAFENTLRYHSTCRSPCGARPLTPAITG